MPLSPSPIPSPLHTVGTPDFMAALSRVGRDSGQFKNTAIQNSYVPDVYCKGSRLRQLNPRSIGMLSQLGNQLIHLTSDLYAMRANCLMLIKENLTKIGHSIEIYPLHLSQTFNHSLGNVTGLAPLVAESTHIPQTVVPVLAYEDEK